MSNAPSGIQGLDVSHYQSTIDWATVGTADYAFVFIKATQGMTSLDPQFVNNWQGAQSIGLLRGAYHFFEAADDPTAQAQFFLEKAAPAAGDLLPAVDVEVTRGVAASDLIAGLEQWLGIVEEAIGVPPLIYTAPDFWDGLGTSSFGRYPLWVAEYGVSQPRLPAGWESWTFWQWSMTGSIAEVPVEETDAPLMTMTDLDVFAGSRAELQALTLGRPAST